MDIKKVIEGWRNYISPDKDEKKFIEHVALERNSICKDCPFHSHNNPEASKLRLDAYCTNCGCTLAAKTRCLTCSCPLNKWTEEKV